MKIKYNLLIAKIERGNRKLIPLFYFCPRVFSRVFISSEKLDILVIISNNHKEGEILPPIKIKVEKIAAFISMIVPWVQGGENSLGILVEFKKELYGVLSILVKIPPQKYTRDAFIDAVIKAAEPQVAEILKRKKPPVAISSIEKEQAVRTLKLAEQLNRELGLPS